MFILTYNYAAQESDVPIEHIWMTLMEVDAKLLVVYQQIYVLHRSTMTNFSYICVVTINTDIFTRQPRGAFQKTHMSS